MAAKKYFLDQEFIEGWRKPIWWLPSIGSFNKKYFTIELISIGIVCDDGREYFAVNKNFNERYASDWVKENVIKKLPPRYIDDNRIVEDIDAMHGQSHVFLGPEPNDAIYKSLDEIKENILVFIGAELKHQRQGDGPNVQFIPYWSMTEETEWYGYYADYDWVLFCSLFGTMMDLPKGMPMFCIDLKQFMDKHLVPGMVVALENNEYKLIHYPQQYNKILDGYKATKEGAVSWINNHPEYPKNDNDHDSLSDSKWSYELFLFMQKVIRSIGL